VGGGEQPIEIGERAEHGIDVAIIGNIIAEVGHRGWKNRGEPDGIDAKADEIIEPAFNPAKIADAVAVAVLERSRIDLIDGGQLPPAARAIRGFVAADRLNGDIICKGIDTAISRSAGARRSLSRRDAQ
jgi:hypothetical protein